MIHSLAGGVIKNNEPMDIAKVMLDDGNIRWCSCNGLDVREGDRVQIENKSTRNNDMLGVVLRVDDNVSPLASPVPTKHILHIIKVLK